MAKLPSLVPVERACEVLGLSRARLVQLLVSNKLNWTMAADKTVAIELPADIPGFLSELKAQPKPGSAVQPKAGRTGKTKVPPAADKTDQNRKRIPIFKLDPWEHPRSK